MSLVILCHFLCAQHVSVINISIIKSLRLFCWITTLVVLFLVRCVLEFRCGWVGVVSMLLAVVCLSFGVVGLEWYPCFRLMCVGVSVWLGWSGIRIADWCVSEFRCGWFGVVSVFQAVFTTAAYNLCVPWISALYYRSQRHSSFKVFTYWILK